MASAIYAKILEEAKLLSTDERKQLIEDLVDYLDAGKTQSQPTPRWEDLIGTAPYPLCGEDAQEWVTRTRRESDEQRKVP